MHVDGLRFDLASVFGRDYRGNILVEPPVVEQIANDGLLADTKLIAEPWDAAGLNQVGCFPFGRRWSEWNEHYRDDLRRFWRGDPGLAGALATRLCGSADLYEAAGRFPVNSINFITCHDGFTLWDLLSYSHKHNEANGEDNRDGLDENYSCNCGREGDSGDPEINTLRQRRAKNLMATLLLSQGVPMILGGDEFLRTQGGNNNAWCQDNETSWIDWRLADRNADFLRFVREMIALRFRHPALRRRGFFRGAEAARGQGADVIWQGVEAGVPAFAPHFRTLAFCLDGSLTGREPDCDFYIACNAWREAIAFRVPPAPCRRPWRRVVDTALASPGDIVSEDEGPVVKTGSVYSVSPHSLIVLMSG
jgi:glycogen operon protein